MRSTDKRRIQRNEPQQFNLSERVYAGYIQNSINFGKWRLYAGIRFEATDENIRGNIVTIDPSGKYAGTTASTRSSGYIDPLPSMQLRYALTPDSGIRVAYGRGLARPNFSDLPPYQTVNDRRNSISSGNPNLQPTYANNYDVLYEHYLKPLGVLEAGFFYKDISQPIYFVNSTVSSGSYTGFNQTQPVNGSSAYLWGFEALTSSGWPICRARLADSVCRRTTATRIREPTEFPAGPTVRRCNARLRIPGM